MVAQGAKAHALEAVIGEKLRSPFVVAVDSGTSALMLAIRGLIRGKTSAKVAIPSYACASLLFAVKNAGAVPLFIDGNVHLGVDETHAKQMAQQADVLVLVHPFGLVEPLLAASFPCPVIEDIAQSAGASLHGQPVGSFGDVCVGSLYATKPWGGAYGGFVAASDATLVQNIRNMCDPDHADIKQAYAGHHQLSDVHAALALQRLGQADRELEKRQAITRLFADAVADTQATWIATQDGTQSNDFRFIVRCQQDAERVIQAFRKLGIAASKPVAHPLHHASAVLCRQTDYIWQHHVSIPMLPDSSAEETDLMIHGIHQCL